MVWHLGFGKMAMAGRAGGSEAGAEWAGVWLGVASSARSSCASRFIRLNSHILHTLQKKKEEPAANATLQVGPGAGPGGMAERPLHFCRRAPCS